MEDISDIVSMNIRYENAGENLKDGYNVRYGKRMNIRYEKFER